MSARDTGGVSAELWTLGQDSKISIIIAHVVSSHCYRAVVFEVGFGDAKLIFRNKIDPCVSESVQMESNLTQ